MEPRTAKEAPQSSDGPSAGPVVAGPATCNGIGQLAPIARGFFPPDTHGAVGANHFGQVVNSAIRFYTKALTGNCPTATVLQATLNGFFGYGATDLFDPRLVYDLTYNRWIVSSDAFKESATRQLHHIAVSVDSDPTHGFFIYSFDIAGLLAGGANFFWDFPQIGYDEEAVLLTGNVFNPGFQNSEVLFLPKHRMYAGMAFSFCFLNFGNGGTVAPPIVLDQSPMTVFTTALPGTSPGLIRLQKWTGTSHVCPSFLGSSDIAAAVAFNIPPHAPQPGTAEVIDTSDTRFVTAGTQMGEPAFGQTQRVWQTHTVGSGGFAIPRAYRIDVGANTIEQQCQYFRSVTSFDWNASIAANGAGTTFITWSATDPPNNINPEVRITGKAFADGCAVLTPGLADNTSANPLTGNFDPNFGAQRWGDYSAVTLDPADTTQAWFVNEKVQTGLPNSTWKSRFGNMHNP